MGNNLLNQYTIMKAFKCVLGVGHISAISLTSIDGFRYIKETASFSESCICSVSSEITVLNSEEGLLKNGYSEISACEFQSIKLKALKQVKSVASELLPSPVFAL